MEPPLPFDLPIQEEEEEAPGDLSGYTYRLEELRRIYWVDIAAAVDTFKVETDTDCLSMRDLYDHESAVTHADIQELKSFISNRAFYPENVNNIPARKRRRPIDATWVRR